jgi:hypothetical protein
VKSISRLQRLVSKEISPGALPQATLGRAVGAEKIDAAKSHGSSLPVEENE